MITSSKTTTNQTNESERRTNNTDKEKATPKEASTSALYDGSETVNSTVAPPRNPSEERTETVDSPKLSGDKKEQEPSDVETAKPALPEVRSDAQVDKIFLNDAKSTRQELSEQDKFMICLAPPTTGEDSHETFTINGHMTRVQRGTPVSVSESVYLLAVQSGKVPPQREKDQVYAPQRVTTPFMKNVTPY